MLKRTEISLKNYDNYKDRLINENNIIIIFNEKEQLKNHIYLIDNQKSKGIVYSNGCEMYVLTEDVNEYISLISYQGTNEEVQEIYNKLYVDEIFKMKLK